MFLPTNLSPGAHREGQTGFYAGEGRYAKCDWQDGFDLCPGRSPGDEAQAGAVLGSNQGCDDQKLARGRQERRWWPWIALAYGFICAVIGLDVAQGISLAADGAIADRERRRTAISRLDGRAVGTDSRSCIDQSSRSGALRGGQSRSQCDTHRDRPEVELHRHQDALIGYQGSGTRHRVSERAWDFKGLADRINRALKKLKQRGLKAAQDEIEKVKEIHTIVKEHYLP